MAVTATLLSGSAFAQSQIGFGSIALGSSTISTVTFTLTAAIKLGTVSVVTQGTAGLDFTNAGSGTCAAGNTYAAGQTCTVDVQFAPHSPGMRLGAVSVADDAGRRAGSATLSGTGVGPQIVFNPGASIALDPMVNGTTLLHPFGLTVDAGGNLYVVDTLNTRVVELPAGNGAPLSIDPIVNGDGLAEPGGVAVDGAGNLYISDLARDLIAEIPADGRAPIALDPVVNGKGLAYPCGMAFDKANNLFIADVDNARVIELPANGGTPIVIDPIVDGQPLIYPVTVALDGAGNLFIADYMANRVVEVPASGSAPFASAPSVNGKSLYWPYGIAMDSAGDLYIADAENRVIEAPADGSAAFALNTTANGVGLNNPIGIALNSAGDLFIGDEFNNRVVEVQRSHAPELNFAATSAGATSADSPQTVAVENIGNGRLSFPVPASGTNPAITPGFLLGDKGSSGCPLLLPASPSPNELDSGASCMLAISFQPSSPGAAFGSLTLKDDSLNAASAQMMALSGNAPAASLSASMISFGAQQLDAPGAAQQVTLTNTGSAALEITGIAVTGTGASSFIFTNSCGSTLSAGGACAIEGQFNTSTPGAVVATLQISDSALGSPQSVSLTGTGVYPVTLTVTPSFPSLTTAQALHVTVDASGPTGQPSPTGSVTVTAGAYSSASTQLINGSAIFDFAAGSLALGTDKITAEYMPDAASLGEYAAVSGTSTVTVIAAPTATAPFSTTGSASSITSTSAAVSGAIDPGGADTRAWFVYGTGSTLAGASQTVAQDLGPATGLDRISANLFGLTSDTTYYYQLVAENSLGISYGEIDSFSTTEAPYFSVIAGAPISIAPGASSGNTSVITILPWYGFTGTVNLSCAISPAAASSLPTCALPSSVAVNSSAVAVMLTVKSTPATALAIVPGLFWRSGVLAAAFLLLGFPFTRYRRFFALSVLLLLIAGEAGCASGSASNSGKSPTNPGTAPGSYTVTVTAASGSLTQTATVSLTVQ